MPKEDWYSDGYGAIEEDAAEFAGRRPILVDDTKRHIYVGEPNWYHSDVTAHHELPYSTYEYGQGYFGGGKVWGGGNLKWYGNGSSSGGVPPYHTDVAKALQEAGFEIPNADSTENAAEDDFGLEDWSDDESWEDVPHYSR